MPYLEMLTGWDYLVLLIVLLSAGLGLFRGMVKSICDLGSWVVAFIGAPMLGATISAYTGLNAYPWAGLLIAFVGVFFVVRLIGVVLSKGLSSVGLAGADRSLGGIVGLARAVLIIVVLATAGVLLDMHKQPAWQKAVSRPLLDFTSGKAIEFFPDLQKLKPARSKTVG